MLLWLIAIIALLAVDIIAIYFTVVHYKVNGELKPGVFPTFCISLGFVVIAAFLAISILSKGL